MIQKILPVIDEPKPNSRVVFRMTRAVLPMIKGEGNLDCLCGHCKAVLIQGIVPKQVQNIVLQCPKCNHFNEVLF